jgi:CDP-diglyceride synthetase
MAIIIWSFMTLRLGLTPPRPRILAVTVWFVHFVWLWPYFSNERSEKAFGRKLDKRLNDSNLTTIGILVIYPSLGAVFGFVPTTYVLMFHRHSSCKDFFAFGNCYSFYFNRSLLFTFGYLLRICSQDG